MVYHSQEIFNINLPTADYGTNHVDRDTKVEGWDTLACWKQKKKQKNKKKKTINYGNKAVHTQSQTFYLRALFNFIRHYRPFCNFWGVTPRPFKCGVFHRWATDFSFEFIKWLQNDKQRYTTLNASIPGKDRIHQNSQACWTFLSGIWNFKTLACKVHKIWHASDFILIFSKGHNSRKGDNADKKKDVSAIFPCGIHLWNFKTLVCTVYKIRHASQSVSKRHRDNLKPICPFNFFEVGGLMTQYLSLNSWIVGGD